MCRKERQVSENNAIKVEEECSACRRKKRAQAKTNIWRYNKQPSRPTAAAEAEQCKTRTMTNEAGINTAKSMAN